MHCYRSLKIKKGLMLTLWMMQFGPTAGWGIWQYLCPQGRNFHTWKILGWCLWGICPGQGLWMGFLALSVSQESIKIHKADKFLLFSNSSVANSMISKLRISLKGKKWTELPSSLLFSSQSQTPQELFNKSELRKSGSLRNFKNLVTVLNCACICLTWFFLIHKTI